MAAEIDKHLDQRDELLDEIAELKASEKVLGLQGVRTHILGGALAGIESAANHWLTRIGWEGLSIELKPYSETQQGVVRDKISLKINGTDGDNGYEGMSSGQKRRIDVAILFALAEFAAGARGVVPGTLWLDEIMDSLDDEGIAAVSSVLRELATDRAIVVISHNEELADALSPDVHYKAPFGAIAA